MIIIYHWQLYDVAWIYHRILEVRSDFPSSRWKSHEVNIRHLLMLWFVLKMRFNIFIKNALWKYDQYDIQRSILRLWKEMWYVPEKRCQSPRTSSYLRLLISNVSKFLSTSSSSLSFFIWKCKMCAYANDDIYDGHWANGKQDGEGILLYASGNRLEGLL